MFEAPKGSITKMNLNELRKSHAFSIPIVVPLLPNVEKLIETTGNVSFMNDKTVVWSEEPNKIFNVFSGIHSEKALRKTGGWHTRKQRDSLSILPLHVGDQWKKLYTWEARYVDNRISKAVARSIIHRELKHFDVPLLVGYYKAATPSKATIRISRSTGDFSAPTLFGFAFNEIHRLTKRTVLHEVAHALDYLNTRCVSHGTSFMREYADLLEQYEIQTNTVLSMRKFGLKVI